MSARKSERIMNLTICLLMARRFITREQIRELVEGYHGLADASFERTFERDKDELRRLGVPIEMGSNSALFPDEVGYRIRRADFELPPLEFDAAETAALALASTVWEQARLADDSVSALAKLRAAGLQPDAQRPAGLAPSMGAREPAFEPLWRALLVRQRVRFVYRDVPRHVEPWTLAYRRGAWYLLGYDASRGAERLFKLARIEGTPVLDGDPGAYAVPDVDLDARLAALEPAAVPGQALVGLRDGAAPELRRRGQEAPATDAACAPPPGYDAWSIPLVGDMAGELASYGADVVVLGPPALREAVVAHLRAVVGEGR